MSGYLCLVLVQSDRQTTDSPKLRTESGQRTELRQTKAGQIPNRKYEQNPDRIFQIRTKTKQGQDTDSAVRRRLAPTGKLSRLWKIFPRIILKILRHEDINISKLSPKNFVSKICHQDLKVVIGCQFQFETRDSKDKNFFPEL